MEKGMLDKRYICVHQFMGGLTRELIRNMHHTKRPDIKVLYSFANTAEDMLYTVIDARSRLSVEAFFSDNRIPYDSITEVELQCVGRGEVQRPEDDTKAA